MTCSYCFKNTNERNSEYIAGDILLCEKCLIKYSLYEIAIDYNGNLIEVCSDRDYYDVDSYWDALEEDSGW